VYKNTHLWLSSYISHKLSRLFEEKSRNTESKNVFFCICDHFEPYWNHSDGKTAINRIRKWVEEYPTIADRNRDSDGKPLKYSFFYPQEEYKKENISLLS
jgi:hypothetical protein